MVSVVLKIKKFIKNVCKDVKTDHLLHLTHLKSSPSTESFISVDDTTKKINPLALIDYQQLNPHKIPTLETHIRQDHEGLMINLDPQCPWCNRFYFDWLMDHGLLTFITEIHHENDTVVEAQPGLPLNAANQEHQNFPFQLFNERVFSNKEARTRNYHRKLKAPKWMEDSVGFLQSIQEKSVVEVAQYTDHNQFAKLPKSQDAARSWITQNCVYNADDLDPFPIDNNLFVLPSSEYMRGPHLPKYLIMRFDNAIPKNIQHKIWTKWVYLRKHLRRFEKGKNTRDEEPQVHFGMWRHYRDETYLISDTIKQSPKGLKLIREFLMVLRDNVVPRMWALMRRYDPGTFQRHIRVRDQMAQDKVFMDTMVKNDHVDFGGMFYAMAVKDGGSQKIHLDWMDHQGTYAWVINVGPGWEGGDLCFPQLGKRLPTRPGQIIAFQGRYLAHCAAPTIGQRLAITCFTDRSLMGAALKLADPSPPPKHKRRRNPENSRKQSKRGRKDDADT